MDKSSELDGAFLGDVDGNQMAADIQIVVDRAGARWKIKRLGSGDEPAIVESTDPKVRYWQQQVHQELRRQAARSKPVTPNFKERPARRGQPEPVPCPDCNGIEPEIWDCETCKGGGRVPG